MPELWRAHAPRRARFEQDHPDTVIMPVGGAWQACTGDTGHLEVITRDDLGELLDELEERYPPGSG